MNKTITLLALAGLTALAACSSGNPNGTPYANEPGGTIAVAPQWNGPPAAYDPYGPSPVSETMRIPPYNSGVAPAPR